LVKVRCFDRRLFIEALKIPVAKVIGCDDQDVWSASGIGGRRAKTDGTNENRKPCQLGNAPRHRRLPSAKRSFASVDRICRTAIRVAYRLTIFRISEKLAGFDNQQAVISPLCDLHIGFARRVKKPPLSRSMT
jgi:hypothetical protein